MAESRKYISVLNNGQYDLYMKDAEARDALLYPVDISSLTPSSTFRRNALIGINGVLYRSKTATSSFPVTLATVNNQFVTHTIDGRIAYVITDSTLDGNWEIWTDSGVEYSVHELDSRVNALEAAAGSGIEIVPSADWPLPSGVSGKVYRVPGTTTYSDYGWDGTQFVLLATNGISGTSLSIDPTNDPSSLVN